MKRLPAYAGVGILVLFGFLVVNGIVGLLINSALPLYHDKLRQTDIFAYRSWQSVGIHVTGGDLLTINAQGEWLYTPNDYHGPSGHPRYAAPNFYPVSWGPGGTLIGRIGENGTPFLVGDHLTQRIDQEGALYLRINDDILSDNKGSVLVDVTITPADPEYR
ncbi:MAG: hypothetical protein R2932_05130 [Caldilineaceae bacterium]